MTDTPDAPQVDPLTGRTTTAPQGMEAVRVANVVALHTDAKGVRTVKVRCPHCDRIHIHGWPIGSDDPGTRAAHCLTGEAGRWYRIVGWSPRYALPRQSAR